MEILAAIIIIAAMVYITKYKQKYNQMENALDWLCVDEEFSSFMIGYKKRIEKKMENTEDYNSDESRQAKVKYHDSVLLLQGWAHKPYNAFSNFAKYYLYMVKKDKK